MLDLTRLGEELKQVRLAAGLTQQELADLAKVSLGLISMLENGQRNVTLATLDAVVTALGRELVVSLEEPLPQERRALLNLFRQQIAGLRPGDLSTLEILLKGWSSS